MYDAAAQKRVRCLCHPVQTHTQCHTQSSIIVLSPTELLSNALVVFVC